MNMAQLASSWNDNNLSQRGQITRYTCSRGNKLLSSVWYVAILKDVERRNV